METENKTTMDIGKDPRYQAMLEAAARKGQDVLFENVRLMFNTEFMPMLVQSFTSITTAMENRVMAAVNKWAEAQLNTDKKVQKMEKTLQEHASRFSQGDDNMSELNRRMGRIEKQIEAMTKDSKSANARMARIETQMETVLKEYRVMMKKIGNKK